MLFDKVPNSVTVAAELYVQSFSRCLASLAAVREQEALRVQSAGGRADFVYYDEVVEAANHLATRAVEMEFGPDVLETLAEMSVLSPVGARPW